MWTTMEKDNLKKSLMIYGYSRWNKIMENSKIYGGTIHTKNQAEVKAYANSFIRNLSNIYNIYIYIYLYN